jgi:hypothetical protein
MDGGFECAGLEAERAGIALKSDAPVAADQIEVVRPAALSRGNRIVEVDQHGKPQAHPWRVAPGLPTGARARTDQLGRDGRLLVRVRPRDGEVPLQLRGRDDRQAVRHRPRGQPGGPKRPVSVRLRPEVQAVPRCLTIVAWCSRAGPTTVSPSGGPRRAPPGRPAVRSARRPERSAGRGTGLRAAAGGVVAQGGCRPPLGSLPASGIAPETAPRESLPEGEVT